MLKRAVFGPTPNIVLFYCRRCYDVVIQRQKSAAYVCARGHRNVGYASTSATSKDEEFSLKLRSRKSRKHYGVAYPHFLTSYCLPVEPI